MSLSNEYQRFSIASRITGGKAALLLAGIVLLSSLAGCVPHKSYMEKSRQDKGLILILPGIEGESMLNHNIADGLKEAGVPDAIDIYDWTGTRFFMVGNMMRYQRNLRQASIVAQRLASYQRSHPGRPVHLIGHSGGAGLAVMVLEQMSRTRPITGAILLAPALSPSHNLAEAMQRTQYGIYNFWSPGDFAWLGIGTTAFGNIDREHGPGAGMVGFKVPEHMSKADTKLYDTKLRQICWRKEMLAEFHIAPHMGWASKAFVKDWLGKIVLSHEAGVTPALR